MDSAMLYNACKQSQNLLESVEFSIAVYMYCSLLNLFNSEMQNNAKLLSHGIDLLQKGKQKSQLLTAHVSA